MKFPKDFFSEEDRNGFVVPEMMKRAWAAELEVLEVIRTLCLSEGIKWYAFYGTLLGAIRHKGFIPWDDDIDIYMTETDYSRFRRAFSKKGDHIHYYLQEWGKTRYHNQTMITMAKIII